MTERLRLFRGATELNYAEAKYIQSDDQVVDKAEAEIEADATVTKSSVIDFKKKDGTTVVFSPTIIHIKEETTWKLSMLARGYELMNIQIEQVYLNKSPEFIVQDIVDNSTQNLTYASIDVSGVTITKYVAEDYAIDVIEDMMILLDWQLRIDASNNVFFEPRGNVDNGFEFIMGTGGNINITAWEQDDSTKFNRVKVRGAQVNHFTRELATGDGSKTNFDLGHKPVGTVKVFQNGVELAAEVQGSGPYDVDPEGKQIVFATPPANLDALIFDYAFQLPIVIDDQDDASIAADQEIFKKVDAPFISTFADARRYARELLNVHSDGELKAKGFIANFDFTRQVGEVVTLTDNIRSKSEVLVIRKIIHNISRNRTEFEFGSREFVFFDWQNEVQKRIKKLERRIQDQEETAFSRTLKHNVSVTMTSQVSVYWNSPRNSFLLGHESLSRLRPNRDFEADCSDSTTDHNGTWTGSGIGGSQFAYVDVFTNLVSYYRFDEGDGTTPQDSKGTNNGTNNGATILKAGMFGYALDFDGLNDFVDLTDDADFEFGASDFAIEAWIKLDTLPSSDEDYTIFSKFLATGNQREYKFFVDTANDKLGLTTSNDGTAVTTVNSNTAFLVDVWNHVLVNKVGTIATFYLNGVADGSGTVDATLATGTAKAYIGAVDDDTTSPDSFFDGKIDNVRIYSEDVTVEQIKELHNQTGKENFRLSYGIFNGSDRFITTPDHADLDGGTNFSVTLAVKVAALPGSLTWLMNKYDGTDGWGVRINASNEVELFYSNGTVDITFDTNTVLVAGLFQHIVFTKAGTSLIAYVDGVSANTVTASHGTISTNTNAFEVGRQGTNWYGDILDEVRIYTKELNSTEASNIANKVNVTDSMVLYWSMDDPILGDQSNTQREWNGT